MLNIYCWSCGSKINEKDVLGLGKFDEDIGKYKGKGFITFKCGKCNKVRYQIINRSLLSRQKKYINGKAKSHYSGTKEKENININQVIDFFESLNQINTVDCFLKKCEKSAGTSTEVEDKSLLEPINQPLDVYNLFIELSDLNEERLMILALNSDNFPVSWEFMGGGLDRKINLHPRTIYHKPFLIEDNVSVILARNIQENFKKPENKEVLKIKRLKKAGKILGIQFLDFIVIDDKEFYSYDDLDLI